MHANFEAVARDRIQRALLDEKLLVIFGWRPKNHSERTRALPVSKVRFFERLPSKLPQNTGVVAMTRFIDHNEFYRVRGNATVDFISQQIPTGMMKRILQSLEELFQEAEEIRLNPIMEGIEQTVTDEIDKLLAEAVECLESNSILSEIPDESLAQSEIATTSTHEEKPMDQIQEFIKAFELQAKLHPKGLVSIYTTSEMLKKDFPGLLPATLATRGVLEKVREEGKNKAGWYRLKKADAPEDQSTFGKVQRMLAREEELKAKLAELKRQMEEIEVELVRTGQVRQAYENLEMLITQPD